MLLLGRSERGCARWLGLGALEDNPANDEFIREHLTAKTLNFPLDQPKGEWTCVVSGKTVHERALIGKSY